MLRLTWMEATILLLTFLPSPAGPEDDPLQYDVPNLSFGGSDTQGEAGAGPHTPGGSTTTLLRKAAQSCHRRAPRFPTTYCTRTCRCS